MWPTMFRHSDWSQLWSVILASLCSDFSTTMAEGAEESQKKVVVRLTVKTAKEKQVVEVDEDAGVKEVR